MPLTIDLARSGTIDAGDQIDHRRLARARLAQHGDELAVLHLQVDAFQRGVIAGGRLVDLDQLLGLDRIIGLAVGRRV